jgi:hypothetical protein
MNGFQHSLQAIDQSRGNTGQSLEVAPLHRHGRLESQRRVGPT